MYFYVGWHSRSHVVCGRIFADGCHHITVKAMVEDPIRNAYAVIEVYPAKLNEIGYEKEPSREMNLEGLGSAAKKETAQQVT